MNETDPGPFATMTPTRFTTELNLVRAHHGLDHLPSDQDLDDVLAVHGFVAPRRSHVTQEVSSGTLVA